MKKISFYFSCVVFVLFVGSLSSPTANAQSITQVMSGLDNPRHLAFGPEGALYVAEAGHGGAGPCLVLRGALQCAGSSLPLGDLHIDPDPLLGERQRAGGLLHGLAEHVEERRFSRRPSGDVRDLP